MVTGPSWMPCADRAIDAYRQVVTDIGGEARLACGDFSADRGAGAAVEIMTRWPDTDAIFAISDVTALGVLNGLRRLGVGVPGDVAVAGFDDITFAGFTTPALTTSTHPVEEIAAGAVRAVLDRTAPGSATFYPSELVVRESA
jgi:DNA-binding LacI/PurR family transcriptional regulator